MAFCAYCGHQIPDDARFCTACGAVVKGCANQRSNGPDKNMTKECNEAIEAGQRAILSLRKAERALQQAQTIGYVDILGGGVLSSMMKHSKISTAKTQMESARFMLNRFRKELGDVSALGGIQFDHMGALSFLDCFMDNTLADIIVQQKINQLLMQVRDAVKEVEHLVWQLRKMNF